MKANICIDRNPSYPIWGIYIPDGPTYWKKIMVCSTEKEAVEYCQKNDFEIEGINR